MDNRRSVLIAATVASYVAIVVTAVVLGFELLTVPGFGSVAFFAIVGIHALIGVGEAILTCAILAYFVKARPGMISLLSGREVHKSAVGSLRAEAGVQG